MLKQLECTTGGNDLIKKFGAIAGIGLVFAVMSEFWFYPVALTPEAIIILLAYGLFGYLFFLVLLTFRVSGFAGFFLSAALFGFAIEGIPVAVLFESVPFSLIWTSLAWHALLSVTLGWLGYRVVMSRKSWAAASLYNLALGLLIGIWGGYFWNVRESDAEIRFEWSDPEPFFLQFAIGVALFMAGHALLDRLADNWPDPSRYEFRSFLIAAALAFAGGSLIVMFPVSLILPALAVLCFWKLNQLKGDGRWAQEVLALKIPASRYILGLLLLGGGYLGYSLIYFNQVAFETNAVYASVLGIISVGLFVRSLLVRAG